MSDGYGAESFRRGVVRIRNDKVPELAKRSPEAFGFDGAAMLRIDNDTPFRVSRRGCLASHLTHYAVKVMCFSHRRPPSNNNSLITSL